MVSLIPRVWLAKIFFERKQQSCNTKKTLYKAIIISLVVFVLLVSPHLFFSKNKTYLYTVFSDYLARPQLYIGVTSLGLEITKPSPRVDYVLSQDLNDYRTYVIAHQDLFEAYKDDSKKTSIEQWGRMHYQDHGYSEGRSMAYLTWRNKRKYSSKFAPVRPVKFEVFDQSVRVRLDFDTPRSYVSVGNLCFTMMTITISCWYPVSSTDVKNVVFETSDVTGGGSFQSTFTLHHLRREIKKGLDEKLLVFKKEGNDPYLVSDENLLLGVTESISSVTTAISNVVYTLFCILLSASLGFLCVYWRSFFAAVWNVIKETTEAVGDRQQRSLSTIYFVPVMISIPITSVLIVLINPAIVQMVPLISIAGVGMLLTALVSLLYERTCSLPKSFLLSIGLLTILTIVSSVYVTMVVAVVTVSYYIWSKRSKRNYSWMKKNKKIVLMQLGVVIGISIYNLQFVPASHAFLFSSGPSTEGDADWLFKLILAIMTQKYGVVSTGLHGTPLLQYHILPSMFVSAISRITESSLTSVLAYVYCLVVNPLLSVAIVYLSTRFVQAKSKEQIQMRWVWYLIVFGGILPYGVLVGGFYTGTYASVGLLMLMVFMSSLLEEKRNVLVCSTLLVLLTLTKVPFGFMGHILVGGYIVYSGLVRRQINYGLIFTMILGGLGFYLFWFLLAKSPGDSSPFYPGPLFEWFDVASIFRASSDANFLLAWFGVSTDRGKEIGSLVLGLIAIYWVLLVSYLYLLKKDCVLIKEFCFAIIFVAFIGSGALSLRFMNGNHLYFANFASLVCLPVVVGALTPSLNFTDIRGWFKVFVLCVLLGVGGIGFFTHTESAYSRISSVDMSKDRFASTADPTTKILKQLGELETHENYLVYVAPDDNFWQHCSPRKAFSIPLVAKRPGLRSLVYCSLNGTVWGPQNYYWWTYGYEAYGWMDFNASQEVNVPRGILCAETTSLGFEGYFHVQDQQLKETVACD